MRWSQCFTSLADQRVSLPRFGHSAAAVSSSTATDGELGSDLVVVYGGVGLQAGETAQTALSDVVVLQVDSGTWFAPDILAGSSPGARAFHSAVAIGDKVLVFGGHILTFDQEHNKKRRNFFNDVWQLDTIDWQWSPVPVDTGSGPSPPGRDMACLLQLTDSQLLLFGGRSETGKALQDSWLFDINMRSWLPLRPEGPLPSPRKMHSMVKLGANQVVLFGGERDSGPLDDLWVLRGWAPGSLEPLRWTQIKMKVSPAPRFGHAMVAVAPAAAPAAAAADADPSSGETTPHSTADEPPATAIADPAAAAAAMSSSRSEGGASEGAVSVSTSVAAAAAASASGERVVMFGGCLDLSSFLSLTRNYVQSKETWLLDLNMLTWHQLATSAGDESPGERMCHSLTALPDGRLLLLGGRHKDGICRDLWWLDPSAEVDLSSRTSASGSAAAAAANMPPPSPVSRLGSQQSLLQSLLGPMRTQRDSAQGQPTTPTTPTTPTAAADKAAAGTQAAAAGAATGQLPSTQVPQQQQQQQQQQMVPAATQQTHAGGAAGGVPTGFQVSSSSHQQQQQFVSGQPQQLHIHTAVAAAPVAPVAAAAPRSSSSSTLAQLSPMPPGPPPPPLPAAPAAVGPGSSSSSSQPLAALLDAGVSELAKLTKNPAAYSAGAVDKLRSSVTNKMSNLLAQGQQGPLANALPAALSRVTPGFLGSNPNSSSGSSNLRPGSSSSNPQQTANLAALRSQLGLAPAAAAAGSSGPVMAPGIVLQQLASLGQQLLGDDGSSSSSSLPPDVLVSAARQHLMSTGVMQLHVPQVALLLADYQHLAADQLERTMIGRLSEGFTAAASHAGGCSFMHRQPHELLIGQVQQLQAEYRLLLVDTV